MLVHLVAQPLTGASQLDGRALRGLADGIRAAGASVNEHLPLIPDAQMRDAAPDLTGRLIRQWDSQQPDIVHTIGVAATAAALAARGAAPVVATFDEEPVDWCLRQELAAQVDAVMPLSTSERDRWRSRGVRTLSAGVFPLPTPVPDAGACASPMGHVVTLASGTNLDMIIASMPRWAPARLVVLTSLTGQQVAAARHRAVELGVAHRVDFRPGVQGSAREEVWAGAALLVAGSDTAGAGTPILEAAARGIPAVAPAVDANLDHLVSGITGVLVERGSDARVLGRAVAMLLEDPFRVRAMGMTALVRVNSLYCEQRAGQRVLGMYREVIGARQASAEGQQSESGLDDMRAGAPTALALENLPLARQLAGWYSGRGQRPDDLTQVAFVGLVSAAGKFDPTRGKAFHAFAVPTILGELRKHFRDNAWAVRVPRELQETTLRVHRAAEELQQSLGRTATLDELADELGLLEQEVAQAVRVDGEAKVCESLDRPVDEDRSVADFLGGSDPALDLADVRGDLQIALGRLSDREQEILLMRFFADRTQSEIAEHLGMSQVHVSRVLSKTLALLRDDVMGDEPAPVTRRASVVIPAPRAATS